jgi:putative ABC transport system ATP-binding protein
VVVVVKAEALQKHYAQGTSAVVRALDGVDLEIEQGDRLVVLGRSGSGKSTLLHLIGGLDRPTAGSLEVEGHDLAQLDDDDLARFRAEVVGFVFQAFHLQPRFPAWENVALPLVFAGVRRAERKRRAMDVLERVGLAARADHAPSELSGGEKQRVAVARSLVLRPRLLLADEPTGNLDSETSRAVIELLREAGDEGTTLVVVTHDEELARGVGRRVVRMADGRVANEERVA